MLAPMEFGIVALLEAKPGKENEVEAGRKAHLEGGIAQALMGKAGELLATPPDLRMADLLAVK